MFSFPAKRRRDDQIDDLEERSLHERKVRRGLGPIHLTSPVSKASGCWDEPFADNSR